MKKVYLICNAHLDPVWLWEWEEGAAETLSTFRTAAEFCEENNNFIFNHNEAILYKWIEEYDPSLFKRIHSLVKNGKWNIMGGWHLQPDCNMPSGESLVRQILTGKNYFRDKFGVENTTAINFDSFGHSRGLVQILKKSGYDSYIVCRPQSSAYGVNSDDFVWVGYDGSEVMVHRSDENYNSIKGKAFEKLKKWLDENRTKDFGLFLWGIGDHGGGPSRKDIKDINSLINKVKGSVEIIHSFPEKYFNKLKDNYSVLPRYDGTLNPTAQGCYTSQILVKQKHRQLENEVYMIEKMSSNAAIQGYIPYPKLDIDSALYDLMTAEFHDALPGSAIKNVEEATLRLLNHGLEITSRIRAKAFFALSSGQKKVIDGETPILVYNPHPYKIKKIIECEFVLPSQNWEDEFSYPIMYQKEKEIKCQPEQEFSNFRMDWRKHAVFVAELEPSQMNRFDVNFKILPKKPEPLIKEECGKIIFRNQDLEVIINSETGFIDKYSIEGVGYLHENAFIPIIIEDSYNSWGGFESDNNVIGKFKLMLKEEGSKFSGLPKKLLKSVRIIEDGEVRTVIEAVLSYNNSSMVITYNLPKEGTEVEVKIRVYWREKDKMLKLSVPTLFENGCYIGETVYGYEELKSKGEEVVSQKWVGITDGNRMITIANDCIYGSSCKDGDIMLTLLRCASYSTTDFLGRTAIPQDRFTQRMDQGERVYNFWINGGKYEKRLKNISKEALYHNEKPFALSYCPSGTGVKPMELITLSDETVQLTTFKRAENSEDYIIRIFEPTGCIRSTIINIPFMNISKEIKLNKFEIKTLKVDLQKNTIDEVGLMET